MQKLPLLLGIPVVFIAGIAAYETGQLLWLGLVVPLAIARVAMRRSLTSKDDLYVPRRDRPGMVDTDHEATSAPVDAAAAYAILQSCRYDDNATSDYDMLAGGLVWSDEQPPGNARVQASQLLRRALAYRASLSLGEPRADLEPQWNELKRHVPGWPGFRDDRIHGRAQRLLKVHKHKEARILRDEDFDP